MWVLSSMGIPCGTLCQMMPMTLPTETQICEDRDFVEWHRGCPWCAVWVLRVEIAQLELCLKTARGLIAPWLLPRYERQPHITVAYRGLMAGQAPHPHAAFGAQQWQQDVQTLQLAQPGPFTVQIGGVGSFSTVPYIAVQPHLALLQLHTLLAQTVPEAHWQYEPHVTIGHYSRQVSMQDVMLPLQACSQVQEILDVPVQALWLARYRTDDIAGRLFFEGYFDLCTQTYHSQPGALLGA